MLECTVRYTCMRHIGQYHGYLEPRPPNPSSSWSHPRTRIRQLGCPVVNRQRHHCPARGWEGPGDGILATRAAARSRVASAFAGLCPARGRRYHHPPLPPRCRRCITTCLHAARRGGGHVPARGHTQLILYLTHLTSLGI